MGVNVFSQNTLNEYLFIKSFIDREEWKEAKALIDWNLSKEYNKSFNDTLHFLSGFIDFKKKELSQSLIQFKQIVNPTIFNEAPRFYLDLNLIANGELKSFDKERRVGENLEALHQLNTLGVKLLERDFSDLEKYYAVSDFKVQKELEQLKSLAEEYQARKWKSSFVAGAMSAVLPGSGKWYAGKKGEAFSSFFQVAFTGFMVLENYRNGGGNNPQFYLFGALFSAYYLGNILGSSVSIHTQNLHFSNQYEKAIVINLRMALRNFYE